MLNRVADFGPGAGDDPIILAVVLIGLAILVFEVGMFVNAIKNHAITNNRKIVWLIGMLLVHPVVAIIYFFTDYQTAK